MSFGQRGTSRIERQPHQQQSTPFNPGVQSAFSILSTRKICSWIEVNMISKLRNMVNTLHFVILKWRRKRAPASSMQIPGSKPENKLKRVRNTKINEQMYYYDTKYTSDFLFRVKITGTENGKYFLDWDMSATCELLRSRDFNPYYGT